MSDTTGFTLHHSNRLPLLAQALGICMAQPHGGPLLTPDTVLIPQPSMRRWLQNSLAEQFGVAANIDFQPPAAFINRMLNAWLPNADPDTLLNADSLRWLLFRHLQSSEALTNDVLRPLQPYLRSGNQQLRSWQLAGELAQTYEKYQAWRKHWLLAWHRRESKDDWQAALWHAASQGRSFRAQAYAAYLDHIVRKDADAPAELPGRLFVFACQSLSPDALRVVQSFARWSDVHFFMHNPCKNYWGDVSRPKTSADILAVQDDNPLLSRWGYAGRDFIASMLSGQDADWSAEFAYYPPDATETPRLLGCVQSDVLERRAPTVRFDAFRADGTDDSIQIHSTHTPLRAVQVLRAQLLGLLAKDARLQWRDIAIMAPDLETYAPHIASVFGQHDDGFPALPFSMSDLNLLRQSPIADLFFRLLDLAQSRFSSNDGFDLLSHAYVAAHFGLQGEDLQRIHYWLDAAGVRWGMDAEHRQQTDGVGQQAFTWRHGLQRLLLGYASADSMIGDMAPASVLLGKDQALLDVLFEFVADLERLRIGLQHARTPGQWVVLLQELLTRFIAPDMLEDAEQEAFQQLNQRILGLQEFAEQAGFKQPLGLQMVRSYLEDEGEQRMSQAWLSGRITLCKMVPMRLIPFKVICLLGMDETAFPRTDAGAAINRLNDPDAERQLGDRNTRSDDRYLFLQLLCSSQSHLLLFYTGNSPHDQSESQPSVLIKELLDCLAAYYPNPDTVLRNAVIRHPIHAFEPESDSRAVFLPGALPPDRSDLTQIPPLTPGPEPEPAAVALEEFIRFWRKPMETLARQRRIRLPDHDVLLDEQEPFGRATGLDKYRLLRQIEEFSLMPGNAAPDRLLAQLQASGQLPAGPAGRIRFTELYASVQDALTTLRAQQIEPIHWPFRLPVGESLLHGQFVQHFRDGVYHLRLNGKMKGSDHLESGLEALVARACGLDLAFFDFTDNPMPRSIPQNAQQAQKALYDLMALYRQGQSRALPFHRSHSFAFYDEWRKDPTLQPLAWLEQRQLDEQDNEHAERDDFGDFLTYGDGFLKRVALFDPDGFAALSRQVCGLVLGDPADA